MQKLERYEKHDFQTTRGVYYVDVSSLGPFAISYLDIYGEKLHSILVYPFGTLAVASVLSKWLVFRYIDSFGHTDTYIQESVYVLIYVYVQYMGPAI